MCCRKVLMFTTPGLPFVPAIAIIVNIYLIFKLSILTLVRFTVWMSLGKKSKQTLKSIQWEISHSYLCVLSGLLMYFKYGIKHSSLENEEDESSGMRGEDSMHNIELSVTKPQRAAAPAPAQPKSKPQQPPPTAAAPYYAPDGGISNMGMVMDESQFPSWDD